MAKAHPTSTLTFLFTDLEGSTRYWEKAREGMSAALVRHDTLLRGAITARGGHVFKTIGDAFCAAFATPHEALAAALDGQRALVAEDWSVFDPILADLRVRMGIHHGFAESRDGDYFGPALNRTARLMSAGHGGQILMSLAAQQVVRDYLPPGVMLLDLGEHRLRDLHYSENLWQVVALDLPHIDTTPDKTKARRATKAEYRSEHVPSLLSVPQRSTGQPGSKSATKVGTTSAAKPGPKPASMPTKQSGATPTSKPASKPATKAVATSAVKTGPKPTPKSTQKAVSTTVKSVPKSTPKPTTRTGATSTAKPVSKPAPKETTKQAGATTTAKPGSKPASKSTTKAVATPIAKPASKPTPKPKPKAGKTTTAKPRSKPASKSTADPATQDTKQGLAGRLLDLFGMRDGGRDRGGDGEAGEGK